MYAVPVLPNQGSPTEFLRAKHSKFPHQCAARHIENDNKYGLPSKKTIQAEKLYQIMGLKLTDVSFKIC
jgi:hypothetical protein